VGSIPKRYGDYKFYNQWHKAGKSVGDI